MMSDYSQRWRQPEGATWKAMLDELMRIVEPLGNQWGAEVTRERGDTPDLDIRWYADDDIGRAIQILIEGDPAAYELVISVSAWKDKDSPPSPRERMWYSEEVDRIKVHDPKNLAPVLSRFDDSLLNAHATVSRWSNSKLTNTAFLPSHDPSLTGRIVKGRYVP